MNPLAHIKILDLSMYIPGPYCSMLLADLGADVIKVEPLTGDPIRDGATGVFLSVNRGKRSLALNLKKAKGQHIFHKLASKSDVILESFRPRVCKRLNIDYSKIRKINNQIIYCSLTAYGQTGPYSERPAFDLNVLALSGALSISGERDGPPADAAGVGISDYGSGMAAAISILCAIIARDKYHIGQYIDAAMLDAPLSWMNGRIIEYFFFGMRSKKELRSRNTYGVFEAKDGQYIALVARFDIFWKKICPVLGIDHLLRDSDYATAKDRDRRQDKLLDILRPIFLTKTSREWVRVLTQNGVPCSPVHNIDRVLKDPQIIHRGSISELKTGHHGKSLQVTFPAKFSSFDTAIDSPPPMLGEHTENILKSLGFTSGKIKELSRDKVVKLASNK